ncbi:MAG: hypothetical protein KDD85_13030 [Parvularculaceae bacterium]|nr:hypothetical protein [Parvularculaceae bacterium]
MNEFEENASPDADGVSPRRWTRLENFLSELPPAAAAKLFAAVESGGETAGLPAAQVLKILRTRLVDAGAPFPERPANARRAFFAPFEDFLISGRKGRKRRARIDRASLGAIWALIGEDAACKEAANAADAYDAALARGDKSLAHLEDALFAGAAIGFARLIDHAEADAAFRSDLSRRLGAQSEKCADKTGAAALHDLAEINFLLPAIGHLKAVRGAFARGAARLTEEELYDARRIYSMCVKDAPQAAPYIPLAIAARMASFDEAFALYYHFARIEDEALPDAAADAAFIAEAAFDDLESMARALERAADEEPHFDGASALFDRFAALAGGVARAAARENDAAFANRIGASRDIAAGALARYCECALAGLRRFLPTRHAGGSSRLMALRPDIARSLDPRDEMAARAGAGFLVEAQRLGAALERRDAARFADDARSELRRYAGDLIAEIRAAEGEPRAAAARRMEAVLRVAAILLADDELALFRERANVALVSA